MNLLTRAMNRIMTKEKMFSAESLMKITWKKETGIMSSTHLGPSWMAHSGIFPRLIPYMITLKTQPLLLLSDLMYTPKLFPNRQFVGF